MSIFYIWYIAHFRMDLVLTDLKFIIVEVKFGKLI